MNKELIMMKKKLLYVLLPLTLLVWGLVFRQIIHLRKPVNTYNSIPVPPNKNEAETPISYELSLNYPDPFLGRLPVKAPENPVKQKMISPIARNTVLTNQPVKPVVKYFGMVSSGENKVGLVSVEDALFLVKERDKKGLITIQEITEDSLKIYNDEKTYSYPLAE